MPNKQAKDVKPTGKTATAVETVATTKERKEKAPKPTLVTTSQLAAKLGTKPTTLRRYLRTLPKYTDNNYTRYGWEPNDPFLADVEASYKKYQTTEAEKKAKREAEAKDKPAKEKKAKKEKVAEPESESDDFEDAEGMDDEEVEEIE
jgi:hypothetical protein